MNMKALCGGEEEGEALHVSERGPERLGLEHGGVTESSRRDEPGTRPRAGWVTVQRTLESRCGGREAWGTLLRYVLKNHPNDCPLSRQEQKDQRRWGGYCGVGVRDEALTVEGAMDGLGDIGASVEIRSADRWSAGSEEGGRAREGLIGNSEGGGVGGCCAEIGTP